MGDRAQVSIPTIGRDGNVFVVIGQVKHALEQSGQTRLANELVERAFHARDFGEAVTVAKDYVDQPTADRLDQLIASGGVNLED